MKSWILLALVFSLMIFEQAVAREAAFIRKEAQSVSAIARRLESANDRRALFASVFALTIDATSEHLSARKFRNPKWVQSFMSNYVNIYRRTIALELGGKRERVPLAWQEEFEYIDRTHPWSPEEPGGFLWSASLDLVYSIHAHIARDLVEALLVTPTDFNSPSIRADYFMITDAVQLTMPKIWQVYLKYEQHIHLGTRIQTPMVMKWIAKLRAEAWENAQRYSGASAAQKNALLRAIDAQVAHDSRHQGIFLLFR